MTKSNKKGFTIIEVVLVLAIAGLIFLMVFIALPAMQRSQRNTQRENDLARFMAQITEYQSHNSGNLPFDSGDNMVKFAQRYFSDKCEVNSKGSNYAEMKNCSDEFSDPDGTSYNIIRKTSSNSDVAYMHVASGDTYDIDTGGKTGNPNNQVNHYFLAHVGYSCGAEGQAVKASGNGIVAVFYVMEGGQIACQDNM